MRGNNMKSIIKVSIMICTASLISSCSDGGGAGSGSVSDLGFARCVGTASVSGQDIPTFCSIYDKNLTNESAFNSDCLNTFSRQYYSANGGTVYGYNQESDCTLQNNSVSYVGFCNTSNARIGYLSTAYTSGTATTDCNIVSGTMTF